MVNLFRILQRHYPQFMDAMLFQISSRREFNRLKASDPATLTDLERAARFNLNHSGASAGGCAARLAGVILENMDWMEFISRYDGAGTLSYLDPPYWGSEGEYGKATFSQDQFELLASRLSPLKGRFIMPINDVNEIRELFRLFEQTEVSLTYSLNGGKGSDARELIIVGGAPASSETRRKGIY